MSLLTPTHAAVDPFTFASTSSQEADTDSGSSSSDSDMISTSSPPLSSEVKQTRQGKDWRPKSTLHLKPRSEFDFYDWLADRGKMSDEYHELKPESIERGPIPTHSVLREHAWILPRSLVATGLQQLSYLIFPQYKWSLWLAYPLYLICFAEFALSALRRFNKYALKYGTLDEKNIGRDRVPDASIRQLARGFLAFMILRTAGEFILRWDASQLPSDNFRWSTPIRWFAWLMTMDYFFYVYHRSCHEIDWLWAIHSKHHTTKHPSPVLAILADEYQEAIEIVLVPLAATLLIPMTFHELVVLIHYTTYVEILGHTGIRANWALPITGPVLKFIQADLMIEDHDLHHRYGKSGRNYGKQTRFWDLLFGTTCDREEFKGLEGHRET